MAYKLEGSILEVCDCKVLCPCWVGETRTDFDADLPDEGLDASEGPLMRVPRGAHHIS